MKCPYCNYEHGYSYEQSKDVKGVNGDFFALPIVVKRTDDWYEDRKPVHGCPSCRILFIGDL